MSFRPHLLRRLCAPHDERGITLMEVTVVGVLAAIVMLALTGFYINSQGTWMDASAQALTQREASLLMASISDSVHASASGTVSAGTLTLWYPPPLPTERCHFWLDAGDSLIHVGTPSTPDQGPIVNSVATRFDVAADTSWTTVSIALRSATGRVVGFSTGAAFYNR